MVLLLGAAFDVLPIAHYHTPSGAFLKQPEIKSSSSGMLLLCYIAFILHNSVELYYINSEYKFRPKMCSGGCRFRTGLAPTIMMSNPSYMALMENLNFSGSCAVTLLLLTVMYLVLLGDMHHSITKILLDLKMHLLYRDFRYFISYKAHRLWSINLVGWSSNDCIEYLRFRRHKIDRIILLLTIFNRVMDTG